MNVSAYLCQCFMIKMCPHTSAHVSWYECVSIPLPMFYDINVSVYLCPCFTIEMCTYLCPYFMIEICLHIPLPMFHDRNISLYLCQCFMIYLWTYLCLWLKYVYIPLPMFLGIKCVSIPLALMFPLSKLHLLLHAGPTHLDIHRGGGGGHRGTATAS